ncbi:MAG: hypothetical protein JNL51_15380 [Chitinophagaceae bacterium]|nr:hypothetical protein [Chitinophagaceae bacterium]
MRTIDRFGFYATRYKKNVGIGGFLIFGNGLVSALMLYGAADKSSHESIPDFLD